MSLFIMTTLSGVGESRYRFIEKDTPQADVVIDTTNLSDYIISERLFGKFTENIGRNIYGGFWAQILENPSLESINTCMNRNHYSLFEKTNLKSMTHEDVIAAGDESRLAFNWFQWNGECAQYHLSPDAYNTSASQGIDVIEDPSRAGGAGIRQPIYLPIHRTRAYNVSFYVKNATAPVLICAMTSGNKPITIGKLFIQPPPNKEWQKVSGTLKIDGPKHEPRNPLWFCIGLAEKGSAQIDQIILNPEDAIQGFDPEVVSLYQQSGIRLLRFPGGNYVSGYHWKDDLVPFDKRPTRRNPAWWNIDPHHVGTDEHIALCRLIGAEPLICINAGNGTPEEAADWVEYCNGSVETKWGRIRAEHGYPEPYNVTVWELGNELWGDWQIGHCTPQEYARRYRAFYNAMKTVDPSIEFIANGHSGAIIPDWTDVLLSECSDIVNCVSLHFLSTTNPLSSPGFSFQSQMGYSYILEDVFRRIHEKGKSRGVNLKVAVTEHMIFNHRAYQPRPETLAEALLHAGTINSSIRTEGIVSLYTHSAFINHGGGMSKEAGVVYPQPVYYSLKELQQLAGGRPAAFTIGCRFADIPDWQPEWAGNEPKRFPLIDVMPVVKKDTLDIILINRSNQETIPVSLTIQGEKYDTAINIFELTGETFLTRNDSINPERVKPREKTQQSTTTNKISISLSPASLVVLTLKRA